MTHLITPTESKQLMKLIISLCNDPTAALDLICEIAANNPEILLDRKTALEREVIRLLALDQLVNAIKAVRNDTGMTLRDAKAHVESFPEYREYRARRDY